MNFKFWPFVRIALLRSTKPTFFKEMFLKTEHRKEGKERRFPNWRNEKREKEEEEERISIEGKVGKGRKKLVRGFLGC